MSISRISSEESARRNKKITITASDEIYSGVRKLAALNEKSMAAYVYDLLAAEVQNQLPAIQKVMEAQKSYKPTFNFDNADETKKAAL